MKIAFIGHSYHKHTGSNGFFIDLLKKLGTVSTFYDESWRLEPSHDLSGFEAGDFDCVVVWQTTQAFQYLRKPHPNIVFVPMYDAMIGENGIRWSDVYNDAKILCFSSALYDAVSRHNPRSSYFQYFPDPRAYPLAFRDSALRGIFWNRVPAIDEHMIARLSGDVTFDQFTRHQAPDPFSEIVAPEKSPIRTRVANTSLWWKDQEDYLRCVARHNVFFAPRLCEGIGMSMLEAMAMGLCVVAADRPTHNEYISHGKNGLLFDPADAQPLNLAHFRELGARARVSIEKGFQRWSVEEDRLLSFVAVATGVLDSLLTRCSA